jgi:hypothetical protein
VQVSQSLYVSVHHHAHLGISYIFPNRHPPA